MRPASWRNVLSRDRPRYCGARSPSEQITPCWAPRAASWGPTTRRISHSSYSGCHVRPAAHAGVSSMGRGHDLRFYQCPSDLLPIEGVSNAESRFQRSSPYNLTSTPCGLYRARACPSLHPPTVFAVSVPLSLSPTLRSRSSPRRRSCYFQTCAFGEVSVTGKQGTGSTYSGDESERVPSAACRSTFSQHSFRRDAKSGGCG